MQSNTWTRFSLACLLMLSLAATLSGSAVLAEDPDEEAGPTPLSEFAPDGVRPARGERYDQGLTINKISIEGNSLIQEEKIKQTMLTRPGSLYSKNNLKEDLRRVYDMGYFTEEIKAVPIATNNGIHLRIEVEEAPDTLLMTQGIV